MNPTLYALTVLAALLLPAALGGWALTRWPSLAEPRPLAARLFFLLFSSLAGAWTLTTLYRLWTTPTGMGP